MTTRARTLLAVASVSLGGTLAVAPTPTPLGAVPVEVHAEQCQSGFGAAGAYSICWDMPPRYCDRIRAHYLTGLGSGGYIFGPWRPNGVSSTVTHANIDQANTQFAGTTC